MTKVFKTLTEEQKLFVKENREEMTVPEMAEHLKTTKARIWRHLRQQKKYENAPPDGFFNVDEKRNWIID